MGKSTKSARKNAPSETTQKSEAIPWLSVVAGKVKALHYGTIEIVVHNSRVVQVEQTESFRFDEAGQLLDPKNEAADVEPPSASDGN